MSDAVLYSAAATEGRVFANRWRGASPVFCCVLAHTDTCLIPGLSAAGVSDELRPFTPAADAEVVLAGRALCLPRLPSHPLGAAGPSGITRAALELGGVPALFVGSGLHVWPGVDHRRVPGAPGASIEAGQAVPHAGELLAVGYGLGRELAGLSRYVVLGESVPGGTTTALALLLALGYAADGRVSGSQPGNAHQLKTRVAHAGLAAAGIGPGEVSGDPLRGVMAVGDPMQPLAAGAAIGAVRSGASVLLAGGSQMLAVAALVKALAGQDVLAGLAIGTTGWVVGDPAADVGGLAADISPHLPVLAANLNFAQSRHPGLRAYEGFMVKEGVGAGGACLAVMWSGGATIERMHSHIDDVYDILLTAPLHTLDSR